MTIYVPRNLAIGDYSINNGNKVETLQQLKTNFGRFFITENPMNVFGISFYSSGYQEVSSLVAVELFYSCLVEPIEPYKLQTISVFCFKTL